MNKDKVTNIKEKQIQKEAKKHFEQINKHVQNPIKAKFVAFKKAYSLIQYFSLLQQNF